MEEATEKKKSSTEKIAGIAILAVVIFGACAYMYANNDTDQAKETADKKVVGLQKETDTEDSDSMQNETNETTNSSADTTDWKTYKNTKYGFSLTFNDLWKNYSIVDRKPDLDRDGEITMSWIESYLYVCAPTASKEWSDEKPGTFCPFAITIVKADKYEEYKEDMSERIGQFVNKNSSYVFIYDPSMNRPDDGDGLVNDASNIISTFELLQ